MIEITEKDKRVTDAWFEEAKNQTIESLPEFLKNLAMLISMTILQFVLL